MYDKLRTACLHPSLQEEFPEWPFPLLFHGHEISRDIFFLDPMLEWPDGPLELGRNPVRDAAFLRYRFLNQWFHYRFFNGLAPVVNSAETVTLLPRILRLQGVLLDKLSTGALESFLEREFSVDDPADLIETFRAALAQITDICSNHELVVWGMRLDNGAFNEHIQYVKTVSVIRTDLVFDLPHVSWLKREWDEALKAQWKEFRKAEARYNKRTKHARRFQQDAGPNRRPAP